MYRSKKEAAQAELFRFLSKLLQEKFYPCLRQMDGVYHAEELRSAIADVFSYYLEEPAKPSIVNQCSLAICNLINTDISRYLVRNSPRSIYWIDIKIYQEKIAIRMNEIREKQKYF